MKKEITGKMSSRILSFVLVFILLLSTSTAIDTRASGVGNGAGVTVKYQDIDTGASIKADTVLIDTLGDEFVADYVYISGYSYVSGSTSGIHTTTPQTVILKYKKDSILTVTTGDAIGITKNSVDIFYNAFSGITLAVAGVQYSLSSDMSNPKWTEYNCNSPYMINFFGLSPNTTYYYQAYLNVSPQIRGEVKSFRTLSDGSGNSNGAPVTVIYQDIDTGAAIVADTILIDTLGDEFVADQRSLPGYIYVSGVTSGIHTTTPQTVIQKYRKTSASLSVTTGTAINITKNSATFDNNSYSGGTPTYIGVLYSLNADMSSYQWVDGATSSPYTLNVSGLMPDTTYYYQAYLNEGAPIRGAIKSFRTQSASGGLSVTTGTANNIASNSVTIPGNTYSGGTPDRTGVLYSLNSDMSGYQYVWGAVTSPYSVDISGLAPDTTYYYQAYLNDNAPIRGAVKSFRTVTGTGVAGSVTVKYQDIDTGASIRPDTVLIDTLGDAFVADYVYISGYSYVSGVTSGIHTTAPQTVILKYKKDSILTVTTGDAIGITKNSADIFYNAFSGITLAVAGVQYSLSSDMSNPKWTEYNSNSPYIINLFGLSPNTTYYYQAYLNVSPQIRGEVKSFRTLSGGSGNSNGAPVTVIYQDIDTGVAIVADTILIDTLGDEFVADQRSIPGYIYVSGVTSGIHTTTPQTVIQKYRKTSASLSVTTGTAINITKNSATFDNNSYTGGTPTYIGVLYSLNADMSSYQWVDGATSSPYTLNVSGLMPDTTYYYQAYLNEGAPIRGAIKSFRTQSALAGLAVTTGTASNITAHSATVAGNTYSGTPDRTGVLYSLNSDMSNYQYVWGNFTSPYSVDISGLTPDTTYYYQAYLNDNAPIRGAVKSFRTTTAILPGGTITVKYVDYDGYVITSPTTLNGNIGDNYNVSIPVFPGYTYLSADSPLTGQFTASTKLIILTYTNPIGGNVTVQYRDFDTNAIIAPDRVLVGIIGDPYYANAIPITGYTYYSSVGSLLGTFVTAPQTVVVNYKKDPVLGGAVTVKYIDYDGYVITSPTILNGYIGENYNVTIPVFSGYTYLSANAPLTGQFTASSQLIILTYTNPVGGNVTVKYQDFDTAATIAPDVVLHGTVGDSYTAIANLIPSYAYESSSTGTLTGTFTASTQTVILKYKKSAVKVTGSTVTWDGYNPGNIKPAHVTVYNASDAVVAEMDTTGNAPNGSGIMEGKFEFNLLPGTYYVIASKNNHTTARYNNLVVASTPVTISNEFRLFAGDFGQLATGNPQDHIINALDRSWLLANYELSGAAAAPSDLNDDGELNGLDRSLLISNYEMLSTVIN